jgi:hypothetical protein
MAAVRDVPDMTGQKFGLARGIAGFLEWAFEPQKGAAKPLTTPIFQTCS